MTLFGSIIYSGDAIDLILIDENDDIVFRRAVLNDIEVVHEKLKPLAKVIKAIVVIPAPKSGALIKGLIRRGYRVHLPNTKMAEKYSGAGFEHRYADPVELARMLRITYTNKTGFMGANRYPSPPKLSFLGRIGIFQRLKCLMFN